MARKSDRDDPLSTVRRLLRELRTLRSLGVRRRRRCSAPSRSHSSVYRRASARSSGDTILPFHGVAEVQRALAISPRAVLSRPPPGRSPFSASIFSTSTGARLKIARSPRLRHRCRPPAKRGLRARPSRAASRKPENVQCLDALRSARQDASDPLERADLLLELAETANDYSDEPAASAAVLAASRLLNDAEFTPAVADWLRGRLARAQAHLAETPCAGALAVPDERGRFCTGASRAILLYRGRVALWPTRLATTRCCSFGSETSHRRAPCPPKRSS